MAGVQPLPPEQLADLSEFFATLEQRMGFVPNSMLTMAYKPDLVRAFSALGRAVYAPTEDVPLSLKNMIAHIASSAAGCKYCMAHTASNATRPGGEIGEAKLDRLYAFETDPMFSEKERAALSFAAKAASIPNTTDDSDFDKLREFFSDADIVEIVSVIAYFGYLNRWNDTMGTELEPIPTAVGEKHLVGGGWTSGKHGTK
jgi:uncharacterized peroxidase-related enzyme